jgi:hypothetical protein
MNKKENIGLLPEVVDIPDADHKTKEKNLAKLNGTKIPDDFVRKNNGEWDYRTWTEFCRSLEKENYFPIDFEQLGLLLEEKRKIYLNE